MKPILSFAERYNAPLELRFWMYVDKNGPKHPTLKSKCWLWVGGCFSNGYGQFSNRRFGTNRAHRVSYQLHYRRIPKTVNVLHKCDSPKCVNPKHLFLGTANDNIQDKVSKDRHAKGTSINRSKLTDRQVKEIRRRYSQRKSRVRDKVDGIKALAKEFKVYDQAIKMIVTRKTWKHL